MRQLLIASLLAAGGYLFSQGPAAPDAAPSGEWETRIVQTRGQVLVMPGGQPQYFPATLDTPLEAGDTVQTGADGECDISLSGRSLIHLEKASELNLASLDQSRTRFTISLGGLLGKLAGTAEHPANMEFATPTAWGGLRGTEIGVETTARESRFGVFDEGKFAVNKEGAEVLLTPHMEIASRAGEPLGKAGGMTLLSAHQAAVAELRQNREKLLSTWKALPAEDRRARRRKLLAQKGVAASSVAQQLKSMESQQDKRFQSERRQTDRSQRPRPSTRVPRTHDRHRR